MNLLYFTVKSILLTACLAAPGVFLWGQEGELKPPYPYDESKALVTPEGLRYIIVEEGTGETPGKGAKVTAHYHGLLKDGTVFDSSVEKNRPINFKLGTGAVIKGWDIGFAKLKKGAKAVLIVPPELGYGSNARGKIPANATLYFHVEFVDLEEAKDYSFDYDEAEMRTTESGLKYVIVEKGDGPVPQKGDLITAHYHGLTADGQVFDSSYERGQPFDAPIGAGRVIKGWDEAFTMLPVGTKAVLILKPELAYGAQGNPQAGIPPNATLEFHVELLDVKSFEVKHTPPYEYDESEAVELPSGLKYVIVEEGDGPKPQMGENIYVHYHGLLADGTKFDSSFERGSPFQTQAGTGRVIRGWNLAFPKLNKGARAVLIIPPDLAYGAQARGNIPANSTLYFHVKLYK